MKYIETLATFKNKTDPDQYMPPPTSYAPDRERQTAQSNTNIHDTEAQKSDINQQTIFPSPQQKQASHHDNMSAKLKAPATPKTHTHWRPETLGEHQNQSIHKHTQHVQRDR